MAGANSLTGKAARPGTGDSHVVPPTAQHVIRSTVPEAQRCSELFSILLYNYLLEITSPQVPTALLYRLSCNCIVDTLNHAPSLPSSMANCHSVHQQEEKNGLAAIKQRLVSKK